MYEYLNKLRERKYADDRGFMAALRCVLVQSKRHRAWPALARVGINVADLVNGFVAGLYATHQKEIFTGNLGTTCRQIARARNEDPTAAGSKTTPTERRFQSLAAAKDKDLFDRVERIVRFAKSQDIPVNYQQLAEDLSRWGSKVKARWAQEFWKMDAPGKTSKKEKTDELANTDPAQNV